MANQKTAQVLKLECNGQFYTCIKKLEKCSNPYILYHTVYVIDMYGFPRKRRKKLAEYANFASIISHLNQIALNICEWH